MRKWILTDRLVMFLSDKYKFSQIDKSYQSGSLLAGLLVYTFVFMSDSLAYYELHSQI